MTEGGLVLPTKPAGLGWWPTTFSKVGLPVASPKLQRVGPISAPLFGKVAPTETSVWIAPRSLARHYFDVSDPYLFSCLSDNLSRTLTRCPLLGVMNY